MIRQAQIGDARAIAEVHVASWRSTYVGQIPDDYLAGLSVPKREASWREAIEKNANPVFVTIENDSVTGFVCCGASRDENLSSHPVGEIYAIYLKAEYQGRGFGRELWNAAVSSLKSRGFDAATLWVLESNLPTRGFYESMGCKPDGGRKTANIGGTEVVEVRYRMTLK